MLNTAPGLSTAVSGGAIRTGTILDVTNGTGQVRIRLEDHPCESEVEARMVLGAGHVPVPGDRALVAMSGEEAFVIGILRAAQPESSREIPLSDGAVLRISAEAEGREEAWERLVLLSPDRRPLLEYDTGSGRIRLNAPAGDLELTATEGDIVLNAAHSIRFRGRSIEAVGDERVHWGVEGAPDGRASQVSLDPSSTRIAGANLVVAAHRARLGLRDATYAGDRLSARIDSVKLVVRRLERVADQIHETATRVYTTVRKLLQVRAERVSTRVRSSYRLRAKSAALESDENFKVKGEQIHLG